MDRYASLSSSKKKTWSIPLFPFDLINESIRGNNGTDGLTDTCIHTLERIRCNQSLKNWAILCVLCPMGSVDATAYRCN